MADKRVYPAINLRKSRTRNEELLLGDLLEQQHRLMRALNSRSPIEAMQALIRHIQQKQSCDDARCHNKKPPQSQAKP